MAIRFLVAIVLVLTALCAPALATFGEVCQPWENGDASHVCRGGATTLTSGSSSVTFDYEHTSSNVFMKANVVFELTFPGPLLRVTINNVEATGGCVDTASAWGKSTITSMSMTINQPISLVLPTGKITSVLTGGIPGYGKTNNYCLTTGKTCAGGSVTAGIYANTSDTTVLSLPNGTTSVSISCPALKFQTCTGSYEVSGCERTCPSCGACEQCVGGACVAVETEECCCNACGVKTNSKCGDGVCTPTVCDACHACDASSGECEFVPSPECCCDSCGGVTNANCPADICTPVECGQCEVCVEGACQPTLTEECCCDACGASSCAAYTTCPDPNCGECTECQSGSCVPTYTESCCCDTCGNLKPECEGNYVCTTTNPCTDACEVCIPYATAGVCEPLTDCCCDACGVKQPSAACASVTCPAGPTCNANCEACENGVCVPKTDAPFECCCDPATGEELPNSQCANPSCECCDACGNKVNPACDDSACTPKQCDACHECFEGSCVFSPSPSCCCSACGEVLSALSDSDKAMCNGVCTPVVCGSCQECNASGVCVQEQSEECCCNACGVKDNALCGDGVCPGETDCGSCSVCENGVCTHVESEACCCDSCGNVINPACDSATCTPTECTACHTCSGGACVHDNTIECCCDACGVRDSDPACSSVQCPAHTCDACATCVAEASAPFGYTCNTAGCGECVETENPYCIDSASMFGGAAVCNVYVSEYFTATGGDTWGRVCSQGDAHLYGFGTATHLTSSETLPVLIVGGNLVLQQSNVVSPPGGVYGGTVDLTSVSGTLQHVSDIESVLPFSTLTPALTQLAHNLAGLASNGEQILSSAGDLTFKGCDAKLNVFDIDMCSFNTQNHQVKFDVPAGAWIVINADGACLSAVFTGFDMVATDALASRIVWNFVPSGSQMRVISISQIPWKGSILAMGSRLRQDRGQVTGSVFARIYDQQPDAEVHLPYVAAECPIPCDYELSVCTPPPPPAECKKSGQCGGMYFTGNTNCCAGWECRATPSTNEYYSECQYANVCPAGVTCASLWGQCGGLGWSGPTTCTIGATCVSFGDYYSQCQIVQ